MNWLVDTLLVTGVLIACVLVLRRPVTRWFGPGLAYALWLLPLLRLVLPPITLPAPVVPTETVSVLVEPVAFVGAAAVAAEAARGWDWTALALPLWLGGALAFLAWRAWGYVAMRRRLLCEATQVGSIEGVRLVETPAIPAPVAFGVIDKVIALPVGFMALSDPTRRDLAIAHELEHHRGRDLAVNLAVQPLFALHWFNPLAWYGWRALRRDQEAACDARVLADSGPERRAEYGRLIASFAGGPRLALAAPMACPVLGEKSIIHRLRSLTMTQPTPKRRLLGRALVGAAALALPLTASITYAQSDEPPAPPAPPAAPEAQAAPHQRHMIIIDNPAGTVIDPANPGAETPGLHTRVINREGRTIVLKTTRELSEAEAEEHVTRAMASIPELPETPVSPHAPATNNEHRAPRIMLVRRETPSSEGPETPAFGHLISISDETISTMVRVHTDRDGETSVFGHPGVVMGHACASGGEVREASSEVTRDGTRRAVRMRLCSRGATPEQALSAMRRARERVAANTEMSQQIKDDVLQQLDREIAELAGDN